MGCLLYAWHSGKTEISKSEMTMLPLSPSWGQVGKLALFIYSHVRCARGLDSAVPTGA